MNKIVKTLPLIALFAVTGCATTPPSNYELHRRSGLSLGVDRGPESEDELLSDVASMQLREASKKKKERMPSRVGPVVEKVWIEDLLMEGGHWLQGTYVYVEVERSRWLPELEVGPSPFDRGKVTMKPEFEDEMDDD